MCQNASLEMLKERTADANELALPKLLRDAMTLQVIQMEAAQMQHTQEEKERRRRPGVRGDSSGTRAVREAIREKKPS